VGPQAGHRLAGVAGVQNVEPMQHRFAYVGADLQDLYGVRPATIGRGGRLQDAWFQGGTASSLMGTLARRPDAILVAAETVHDFQLRPGDPLRLRLQDGRTKRLVTVTFHYAGVAREFPTAPTDSFLVANADYVARATGSPEIGTFLLQTGGRSPAQVAAGVRRIVGASAQVTDIETSRRVVGSNLTAVELSGLTRVELALALVLCAAASGLTLALGLRERRQMFAIIAALGARRRQLDALVWSESAFVTAGGLLAGGAIAVVLTHMLVRVLTGVFDPPPDRLAVPWPYLLAGLAVVLAAVGAAAQLALASLRRPRIEDLRDT
jgi:putative ABC transport system permease protein